MKKTVRKPVKAVKASSGNASKKVDSTKVGYPQVWLDAVIKPKATFSTQVKHASWKLVFFNLALSGIIGGMLSGLFYSSALGLLFPGVGAMSLLFIALVGLVAGVFGSLFITLLYYILARLLGGKGGYKETAYAFSLFSPIVSIFYQIPIVGYLTALYALYLNVIAVRETHQISTLRSVIVVLLPLFLVFMLALLVAAFLVVAAVKTVTG